jgi:DNA modification methylase
MERILSASTTLGEVVREPFGGLAPASAAAVETGRLPYVAETDPELMKLAAERLNAAPDRKA